MTNPHWPALLYLVQTVAWELDEMRSLERPRYRLSNQKHGAPVQEFLDREGAEACCAELEREIRAEANPFQYGESLAELTPLDAGRLHDWILDAGLEPLDTDETEMNCWQIWWEDQVPSMTELQRAKMWEALSWLRFFSVIELHAASGW